MEKLSHAGIIVNEINDYVFNGYCDNRYCDYVTNVKA